MLRSDKKPIEVWIILVLGVEVMTVIANRVYSFWVGNSVKVPLLLSVCMALYVAIVAWSNIFAYFINGTGKIRLQIIVAISVSIANVALAIFFAKYSTLKSAGVILATCIAL